MKNLFGIRFLIVGLVFTFGSFSLQAQLAVQTEPVAPPSYLLVKEKQGLGLALDAFLKTSGVKNLYGFGAVDSFHVLEIPASLKPGEVLAGLETAALISESAVDITAANTSLDFLMRTVNKPVKQDTGPGINDTTNEGIPVLLEMKPGASLGSAAQLIASCGGKFMRSFGPEGKYQIVEISRGPAGFHQMVAYLDSPLVQSALPSLAESANLFKGYMPDRLVVEFKEGTSPEEISKFGSSVGAASVKPIYPGASSYRIEGRPGAPLTDLYRNVLKSPKVEKAEPVVTRQLFAVPNDPLFGDGTLWGLQNTGQNGGVAGVDMNAAAGWDIVQNAGNVIIAIIDTGIHENHEDLKTNLWANAGEIPNDGVDNDGNGYVDDFHGMNAETQNGSITDTIGHGTEVAGCVAASGNNGLGASGTAWKAKLMICKFGDFEEDIPSDNILACLDYAIKNGATVISCSFGGRSRTTAEENKIKEARDKGIIVVASAGNNGQEESQFDVAGNNDRNPVFPASYSLDNIISVGSINRSGLVSDFSSYGTSVSLSAPGEEIQTTNNSDTVKYTEVQGTSFSAPYVAGIVALARKQFPGDGYYRSIERVVTRTKLIDSLTETANARKGIPDMGAALAGKLSGLNASKSFASVDTFPKAIPDLGNVSSTIQVSTGGVIASLRLNLTTTHTYPADLYLQLKSPSGKIYTYAANSTEAQNGDGSLSRGLPFVLDDFPVWFFNGESALGTWTLTMTDFWGGLQGSLNTWSLDIVTYVTPPGPGVFAVRQQRLTAPEDSGFISIPVVRQGGSLGMVTIDYSTASGTAISGQDFQTESGTIVFEAGETLKYVSVPVTNDDEIEADEQFSLILSNPTGTSLSATDTTIVTIPKNDLGFFNFSSASYAVVEGQGQVLVTVTRDLFTDTPAAVYFSTAAGTATPGSAFGGGDYKATQGWMLFPAGVATQSFSIPISNDGQPELPETFEIRLSKPTKSASLGTQTVATIQISD